VLRPRSSGYDWKASGFSSLVGRPFGEWGVPPPPSGYTHRVAAGHAPTKRRKRSLSAKFHFGGIFPFVWTLKDYQPLPQINFNCIKIYERKDFEFFRVGYYFRKPLGKIPNEKEGNHGR
jgi:hypothetical protein